MQMRSIWVTSESDLTAKLRRFAKGKPKTSSAHRKNDFGMRNSKWKQALQQDFNKLKPIPNQKRIRIDYFSKRRGNQLAKTSKRAHRKGQNASRWRNRNAQRNQLSIGKLIAEEVCFIHFRNGKLKLLQIENQNLNLKNQEFIREIE